MSQIERDGGNGQWLFAIAFLLVFLGVVFAFYHCLTHIHFSMTPG